MLRVVQKTKTVVVEAKLQTIGVSCLAQGA